MSLTKSDIEEIEKIVKKTIKSEINKDYISDIVARQILNDTKVNSALSDKAYKHLSNFFKFVWLRRNVWKNDI